MKYPGAHHKSCITRCQCLPIKDKYRDAAVHSVSLCCPPPPPRPPGQECLSWGAGRAGRCDNAMKYPGAHHSTCTNRCPGVPIMGA